VLTAMRDGEGFTLIELMIVLVILAVMALIALPNMNVWLQNTQIRTAGEAILNGMQLARAEAIRRNTAIELRMDTASGWTVRVVGTGEVLQSRLHTQGTSAASVAIAPVGATKITFDSFGSVVDPNPDATARITEIKIDSTAIAGPDSRELCVMVKVGGNIRLCDPQVAATDTRSCQTLVGSPPVPTALPAGCL
jgi:type IV fimbrial biogenesis protein FimT